jgi:hypothetical protein
LLKSALINFIILFQFKLEDSTATSSTTSQQPTSPTNGVAQDPLKTTNISSVHRKQNSTENVPSNDVKETSATPNRSDDDKGEKMLSNSLRIVFILIN